ncbi:MAG: DEAD/DEAH box helicase [Bifidobacteriaceae bacterium]|jgi:superfamily II DNA or RNA helicase|nr:DEAD/DEAH box helicase [Bifidobacteriaceae bacterium]
MPLDGFPLVDAVDLRRQVGALTFARGQEYFRRGRVMGQSVTYDPLDQRLYGRVRGTRPAPYECRIWLERSNGKHFVEADSGLCSCPVGIDCKHIVALVLEANAAVAQSDRRVAATPAWEAQLRHLASAIGADEPPAQLAPAALQLRIAQWERRYSSRPAIEARAVRPGKRERWVGNTDLRWNLRGGPAPGLSRAQQRWFEDFARLAAPSYSPSAWLRLTAVDSDAFWPHLARAADLGIALVGDQPGDSIELAELVEDAIDVRASGKGLRLTQAVRIGGEGGEILVGAVVAAVGYHGHAVIVTQRPQGDGQGATPGRRIVLGPSQATVRVGEALRASLPASIPAAQAPGFWSRLYPVLTRGLPLVSADASVQFPALPAARLVLAVAAPTPTTAVLKWSWRYASASAAAQVDASAAAQVDADAAAQGAATAAAHEYPTDSADRPPARWDMAGEQTILADVEAIRSASQAFADPRRRSSQELSGAALAHFAAAALPALRQVKGLSVEGDLDHLRLRLEPPAVKIKAQAAGDGDWFDLGVSIEVGDTELVFADVFAALAAGAEHALAKDGSLVALDHPTFRKLAKLISEAARLSDKPGKPRIGRYQASLWQDLEENAAVVEGADQWRATMAQLRRLDGAAPGPEPLPSTLTATLRPYQKAGYDWLTFIWRHQLGGVLADDMGLGKTVQTLAMIAQARADGPAEAPPFLVVAPSSVVPGWLEEAARFTPGLVVRAASETRARAGLALADLAAGADLVVTSYAIFRLDQEQFAGGRWAGLILDEAQFAKNAATKVNQQARALRTGFKLAITGTPMENSLNEFWAIFGIVAPGLLGSRKQFKELYAGPIAAGGPEGEAAMRQLRRRAKPLLLRRTKERVARDLPDRQEQVIHVELAQRHRELYDTYLQRERARTLGLLEDWEANRFAILKSLTMLRRAALDVSLVDPALHSTPSSKLDVLMDQLDQVTRAGHRALVFSQFTSYLAKVRERLDKAGVDHAYLDGSTANRAAVINGFKQGAAPVFLISLKAGGFGLNLTEADYVFLLDPWWNPATENQAIDRAHRIGQTRPVLVSRLVSENTIEDKVMALKERKQALFDALLDQDGAFSTGLTSDDVRALME